MRLVETLEWDELGRLRLTDEDLDALDEVEKVRTAGGDGTTNGLCNGTSNGQCVNMDKCDGSANSVRCTNSTSCNTTKNGAQCMNTDVPIEVQP